ncbi:uncharacterized protein LOC135689943 isoform X2 [Rhopilema esculentum]|uniref:uncharacterized protein LOC135689943 isoform X2 n=1 Tax=Rhopilema esculentum TaxID=499914 RepID=UPI0031CDF263
MAAVELMLPLLHQISGVLQDRGREEAYQRMVSVYGERYSSRGNLLLLLERLVQEHKITPRNTFTLEQCLSESLTSKEKFKSILEDFHSKHGQEIKEWDQKQPAEFIKRESGWLEAALEKKRGVIIWGVSGVGKTKLAKEFMLSRKEEQQVTVDLRGLKSIENVCVETLRALGKIVSIDDATVSMVQSVLGEQVSAQNMLLLFDNADDFVHYSGIGDDKTEEFAELVKGALIFSYDKLKMLITSRSKSDHPQSDEFLHQEQLHSMNDDDASCILKSKMIHEGPTPVKETDELVSEAIRQCRNLPLNLRILSAALQEKGVSLTDILPKIIQKAREWKKSNEKPDVSLLEEESCTYGVLASRFENLSDTTQLSAVALSLFARSFSFQAAAEILKDFEESKVHLILEHLKGTNFISLESDNLRKSERIFDIHPKVKEFLSSNIEYSREISSFYSRARKRFITFFNNNLLRISKYIDKDYMKACELYQEDQSNFDFIFKQRGSDLLLLGDYDDSQQVQLLLNGMLLPERRLEYFRSLAEAAFKHRNALMGTQYLCWQAMEEGFLDPVKALKYTVLRAEHNLMKLKREYILFHSEKHRQYSQLEALFLYTLGDILYRVIHSNMSLEDCQLAIESLESSLNILKQVFPASQGHIDIVRAYVNLGNIYNILEDIFRKKEMFDDIDEALDKALDCYNKALKMREHLSEGRLHIDTPQIIQNIGSVWYERARIEKMYGEDFTTSSRMAEEYLKQALQMEKDLDLYGLYRTSSKLVNLGDLYKLEGKHDKSFEFLLEALEIRRSMKGKHKDTVLVIYRLAITKHTMKEYAEAVRYYKEAFEMEESLPEDLHSAIRMDIRKYLMTAYERWQALESNEAEKIRIGREFEETKERILQLEKDEKQKELGKDVDSAKSSSDPKSSESPMESEFAVPPHDEIGELKLGISGHHTFLPSSHVYLTVPRKLVRIPYNTQLFRLKMPLDVPLKHAEHLASAVIGVQDQNQGEITLKAPAMLEIRSDIMDSHLDRFSELCMLQYEPVTKTWIDVEESLIIHERFYWFERNDSLSVVCAWIKRFTLFCLVVRPKVYTLSVPVEGAIWKPAQDERISIQFKPGTFSKTADCQVKVALPPRDLMSEDVPPSGPSLHSPSLSSPSLLSRSLPFDLVVSCAVNVHLTEKISQPVIVTLPLIGDGVRRIGRSVRVLRMDDGASAKLEIAEGLKFTIDNARQTMVIEVFSFSWLWVIATPVEYTLKALENLAYTLYRSSLYDVEFNLYRGIFHQNQRIIAVSCTPFNPNREKCSNEGHYTLVDSAPSWKRLMDLEPIKVEVKGQYINTGTCENILRFNKNNPSPSKFGVKETGIDQGRGGSVTMYDEERKSLCSIPYLGDFRIISDSLDEQHGYRQRSPIRFLGLVLKSCGLEKVNVHHGDFRNNLYQTGLSEEFIDELKLDMDTRTRADIVRKLFDRITSHCVNGKLHWNWFNVIKKYLYPPSTRKNLEAVYGILEKTLISERGFTDYAFTKTRGNTAKFCIFLSERVMVDAPQGSDLRSVLNLIVQADLKMITLIRESLHLKREGLQNEVDSFLEGIGEYIESRIEMNH